MVIKTKFYCKTTRSVNFKEQFISGKWYDGEYEKWSEELFKLNNGWRNYWVFDESGVKVKLTRPEMMIFELDNSNLRNIKINDVLNNENGI